MMKQKKMKMVIILSTLGKPQHFLPKEFINKQLKLLASLGLLSEELLRFQ